ncbi:putative protein N(5)-glutamine methyltransferase [Aeromicrobium sp.]|uniref:putative protein N(5)-glutamine methyltransferase n=1 Tax=Aeromicrobium sp. TaxID=1871063 RepID=UPI004033EFB8
MRAAGCVFAEDEARLILQATDDETLRDEMVRRRADGAPLEVLLGWADVAGVRVSLRPGVFVPRRRSSLLVAQGLGALGPDGAVVVDLCCGSGALGLALARARPDVELHAADLDEVACRCAAENLRGIGEVHRGDLFEALPVDLRGRVDLLLVNAPYVPSDEVAHLPREARDHEPRVALDGGVDGVDVHRRVADRAGEWVARGGTVLVETSERQAPSTAGAFDPDRWTVEVVTDDEIGATAVRATRR